MNTNPYSLAVVVAAVAVAATVWLASPEAKVQPPVAGQDVVLPPAAPATPPAVGHVVASPAPVAAADAKSPAPVGTMRFPDGSSRPALNGVTEDLVIPWPNGRPWSPVVEQLQHGGTEWCRHADGSFTTTIVRTETVSGQTVQMPLCCTPSDTPVRTTVLRQ